ncbi:uncharacterized protein MONBRDRAFT_9526 [Monosiga brevicollis MX1]|uniref:SH2 domain-containing protein n=1 Tax=Monosiga brevicollis TaxID=81824 RepID=A9V3F4_MONBE|nr:uncharacterized protein MONBRDRAFT_9526 [Monosiga brevicollis MX1]EDQ88052.1 predicted protein [Monosiga brevicollis MX1]|eukprot:XP_001747128.1 hypothetical protein [Monosiga brevicollis MX1]
MASERLTAAMSALEASLDDFSAFCLKKGIEVTDGIKYMPMTDAPPASTPASPQQLPPSAATTRPPLRQQGSREAAGPSPLSSPLGKVRTNRTASLAQLPSFASSSPTEQRSRPGYRSKSVSASPGEGGSVTPNRKNAIATRLVESSPAHSSPASPGTGLVSLRLLEKACPEFHSIDRHTAGEMLKKRGRGSYLFRCSSIPGTIALSCFSTQGELTHINIVVSNDPVIFTVRAPAQFATIPPMGPDGLGSSHCTATHSVQVSEGDHHASYRSLSNLLECLRKSNPHYELKTPISREA